MILYKWTPRHVYRYKYMAVCSINLTVLRQPEGGCWFPKIGFCLVSFHHNASCNDSCNESVLFSQFLYSIRMISKSLYSDGYVSCSCIQAMGKSLYPGWYVKLFIYSKGWVNRCIPIDMIIVHVSEMMGETSYPCGYICCSCTVYIPIAPHS